VLPRSQLGELPINASIGMTRAAFATYAVVNVARVGHPGQVGERWRASGASRVKVVRQEPNANEAPARRYRLWL
jgi:hypothetical protein